MENKVSFKSLGIKDSILEKLKENKIIEPTLVQAQSIPVIQAKKSLIFQSETGTGKTLAYLLPLVTRCEDAENPKKDIKILIVAPTVELASQIKTQAKIVTDLKTALFVGGAPLKRQIESLKEKPQIVIGTPARLKELIHLKKMKIENIDAIVLDEVDRLLSPEMRDYTTELLKSAKKDIQLIALSATITKSTQKILSEAKFKQENDKNTELETLFLPAEDVLKKRITHIAVFAERRDKIDILRRILVAENPSKALIFTGKLDQVQNIATKLIYKKIDCAVLHAKMEKNERKSAIDKFRSGKIKILITSDLTSRGLDIPEISHVIQMDMPSNEDFFVHRSGRTARAGKTGTNIVIGDEYELRKLALLEKKLGIKIFPKILYKGKLIAPEQNY